MQAARIHFPGSRSERRRLGYGGDLWAILLAWSCGPAACPLMLLIVQDLKTRSQRLHSARHRTRDPAWRAPPGVVVMKFGEQLRSSVIREYQWYYIDYDGLKADLKHPSGPVQPSAGQPNNKPKPGKLPRREWTE